MDRPRLELFVRIVWRERRVSKTRVVGHRARFNNGLEGLTQLRTLLRYLCPLDGRDHLVVGEWRLAFSNRVFSYGFIKLLDGIDQGPSAKGEITSHCRTIAAQGAISARLIRIC